MLLILVVKWLILNILMVPQVLEVEIVIIL